MLESQSLCGTYPAKNLLFPLRIHFQSGGSRQFALAKIEGKEASCLEKNRRRNMQDIRRAAPNPLRMRRTQELRLAERIGPRHRLMHQNPIRQILLNLPQSGCASKRVNLSSLHSKANAVVRFQAMKWIERQCHRVSGHKPLSLIGIPIFNEKGNQK